MTMAIVDHIMGTFTYHPMYLSHARRPKCFSLIVTEIQKERIVGEFRFSMGRESRVCKWHFCSVPTNLLINSCHFHLFSFALHRQIISKNFTVFFLPKCYATKSWTGLLLVAVMSSFTLLCGFDAHYSNEMSAPCSPHHRFLNIGRRIRNTNSLN